MGVLERGEREDDYETDLNKRGLIEMSTTVLSIYAMLALFALNTYEDCWMCLNFVWFPKRSLNVDNIDATNIFGHFLLLRNWIPTAN